MPQWKAVTDGAAFHMPVFWRCLLVQQGQWPCECWRKNYPLDTSNTVRNSEATTGWTCIQPSFGCMLQINRGYYSSEGITRHNKWRRKTAGSVGVNQVLQLLQAHPPLIQEHQEPRFFQAFEITTAALLILWHKYKACCLLWFMRSFSPCKSSTSTAITMRNIFVWAMKLNSLWQPRKITKNRNQAGIEAMSAGRGAERGFCM